MRYPISDILLLLLGGIATGNIALVWESAKRYLRGKFGKHLKRKYETNSFTGNLSGLTIQQSPPHGARLAVVKWSSSRAAKSTTT